MRAEFYRAGAPTRAVGWATWAGMGVDVESKDEEAASAIRRVFRSLPVAVDDPALRSAGTAGPVVLQPGSLRWFTAAARARSEVEGLGVRFVAGETGSIGWDPAGAYRTFQAVVERGATVETDATPGAEAGESRPEAEHAPPASGTEAAPR